MPEGVPEVILPSPEKLDLVRLKADIPKFLDNSRAFSENDKEWWRKFFATREQFYAPQEQPATWFLDQLVQIKRRQQAAGGAHCQRIVEDGDTPAANPVVSLPRPGNIPDSVVAAVSNQFEPVRQVITMA